ncbi:hypothetical protein KIH87_19290 [Paraneptunicella aestuarii]|uniref:hypothetical protein n=1 Tax=Paraneptunicella aestuarii TaxID=2831148 RepID=UPI001E54850A|nr:hypothetical protein [Paraneptunicella aestuarii]UAA38774.1 hypothetical protein KIH87_19290 [Paraneptunicella aestuarii]
MTFRKILIAAVSLLSFNAVSAPTIIFKDTKLPTQSSIPTETLNTNGQLATTAQSVLNNLGLVADQIESSLLNELAQVDDDIISIGGINVNFDKIKASFKHNSSNIKFEVNNIGFGIKKMKYDLHGLKGLVCPTVTFDADLDKFWVSAKYNSTSGDISNIVIDYDVKSYNSSCSGILGFIADTLGVDGLIINPKVEKVIEREIDKRIDLSLGDSVFSIKKLYNNLLDKIQGVVSEKNIEMLQVFAQGLSKYGLVLDIDIDRLTQKLSFTSRHLAPSIELEANGPHLSFFADSMFGADAIMVYRKDSATSSTLIGTFGSSGRISACSDGITYQFVAKQKIISNLYAYSTPVERTMNNCASGYY